MDPPKCYKELLEENQILRENQKLNKVILFTVKRNQDMENQLSLTQSLIAGSTPLQQKAQLSPHPPPGLQTAVLKNSKVFLESSAPTTASPQSGPNVAAISNGLQPRPQQRIHLKPILVRNTCSDRDVCYLPGAISVGDEDPGCNRSGCGSNKLPPIRASSVEKDFEGVPTYNEPMAEGSGAKIGSFCPARPSGEPPLAPKARRQLPKTRMQQNCVISEGCESKTLEKERRRTAREKAAFDRQFHKVDTYPRAELRKVSQQTSLAGEGEGDLGLTLEDEKAKLESSLQKINQMRREWETKGGEVNSTGSAEMEDNKVTLNGVEEKKRSEVMEMKGHGGHGGGIQQAVSAADSNLLQCRFCSRSFAANRLEKHSQTCAKVISKGAKRKVYHSGSRGPTWQATSNKGYEEASRHSNVSIEPLSN